jgi:hypothetical protein
MYLQIIFISHPELSYFYLVYAFYILFNLPMADLSRFQLFPYLVIFPGIATNYISVST